MARLALVDATPGTATAVRAAASGHEVVACTADAVPSGAALCIVDAGDSAPSEEALARLASAAPLLLLLGGRAPSPAAFEFLRKPCDIVDLRRRIQAMLESAPASAAAAPESVPEPWARVPRIPAPAVAILASLRGLDGPVWIAGEPGTGADRVAAELALEWSGGRLPAIWQPGEDLDAVALRLNDPQRELWVPGLDDRPQAERRSVANLLVLAGRRRIVLTTGDDADETAELLGHDLHRVLSRAALRLPPLRERGAADIVALAMETGAAVASSALGARFELADTARRSLEAYEWPGNVDELEAVLTRSVLARAASSGVVELAESDLRYAPDFAAPAQPRRAVVLPLSGARGVEAASASATQASAQAALSSTPSSEGSHVEAVLSAFAHDLRNPMSTLKTFASLAAADASGDSAELARLATGAAERIDGHLEFLQRYTEMATGSASPASVRVDAVDVLGDAIEAAGAELTVEARSSLWTSGDPEAIRFIADAVVAEARERAGEAGGQYEATADLGADKRSIELRIPVGGAAVDRLGKWVEDRGLPWRLALARDLARRGGGDLALVVDGLDDGEMRVRWTPAPAADAEVGRDGGEARSADRRRRSRSS